MILKSIRLHPFGGTRDRTYCLGRPVAVILGPNEAGKSTLRQAIHHALFTPTKLTDKQLEKCGLANWYPRPSSDHAAVTLVFEHAGVEWTLAKRWGAGQASSLAAAGEAGIGDPAAVQKQLGELLGHNEATSRLVLSTGQAELARTVALLARATPDELPPVADVMAAAAGDAGDVGPERLRGVLTDRIEQHFGRWDRTTGRPQLDKGKERGIDAPWERGAGSIVKAWYAWQTKAADLKSLRADEEELDRVSTTLARLEAQLAADLDFIGKGGPLRDGLARRKLVELELERLRTDGRSLAEIMAAWPAAVAAAGATRTKISELQSRKQGLVGEQGDARRRADAEAARAEFAALVAARTEWLAADEAAHDAFQPSAEAIADLEQCAERIKDTRNRIEAQRLAYEIRAREPVTVRVAEGNDPPRDISLGDGVSGSAKSRLSVEAGGVTITVSSGQEDVAALFAALEHDTAREQELLAGCRAASLVEAKAQAKRHDDLAAAAAVRQAAWQSRLRGKSFEQWQAEIDAFASLPQTRDPGVITAEIEAIDQSLAKESGGLFLHEQNIAAWTAAHGTTETLIESLVAVRARIQEGERELGSLPTVPDGFETAEAFLAELARREAAARSLPEQVRDLATRQQQLKDRVGDRTATDLAEEAEALERAFDRTLREGRAYERILEVLEEAVREQETDPLAEFAAKVTDVFRRITGGADEVAFADHVPTQVARGAVALSPELLSQGAGSALALGVRLALAEVYLGSEPGFVVLDDPFVDLDADRRERAKAVVRHFATAHQVIFLTCHEPHAEGLGDTTTIARP